jgi:hypothetical protein
MKTPRLLAAVIVLQAGIIAGLWTGRGIATPAQAQIPDAAAQRVQVVDELKNLNAKMDKLMDLLSSGKVQVKVAPPDDKK